VNKPYTVSELTRNIKGLLESTYPEVSLRGEISNFRQQQSGHIYFSLKDAGASISCVCFRGDASRLKVRLRDGMQIVGTGRIAVYEPRGNYQIIFLVFPCLRIFSVKVIDFPFGCKTVFTY